MSKSISIKEGNQGRNFTPEKLKTALQDGGSCLWVPKDGTRLKTISIRKPGTYQAWAEEVYGYSKATVSGLLKESEIKTISKEITENSTYRAEDEGFYGYDVVSVNVPGGGGTAPPSYTPGSSVAGTYPDGDEPVTVFVDDEGNLIKAGLADHIILDTPPDKLTYHDGERITLAGAVVRGYLKNGTPYKNASYQDSILPLYQYIDTGGDEIPGGIVFPMPLYADISKAEGGGGDSTATIDDLTGFNVGSLVLPFKFGNNVAFEWNRDGNSSYGRKIEIKSGNARCMAIRTAVRYRSGIGQIKSIYIIMASEEPFEVKVSFPGRQDTSTETYSASQKTHKGKTFYVFGGTGSGYWNKSGAIYSRGVYNDVATTGYSGNGDDIAYIMLYGTIVSGDPIQTITLTWPREGDRKHLKTTFEITVTP